MNKSEPTPECGSSSAPSSEPLDIDAKMDFGNSEHASASHDPTDEDSLDLSGLQISEVPENPPPSISPPSEELPLYGDPSSSDDGEGEWITPENIASIKARAAFSGSRNVKPPVLGKNNALPKLTRMHVACITADYAMQNVLFHMGLNLIGPEGKRITNVSTWLLRCHACFK